VEFGFPKRGGPLNSIGAGLLNHQTLNLAYFVNESKSIDACSEFEV
jgi:hypothetical protein